MRTPKAPAGFVPVDSEEARKIADFTFVNYAVIRAGEWITGFAMMSHLKSEAEIDNRVCIHVQLPPKVEWEEVWGWENLNPEDSPCLTYNGEGIWWSHLTEEQKQIVRDGFSTIVRALNEKEGRDG